MHCLLCARDTRTVIADRLRGGEKRKVYYCTECELGMLPERKSAAGLQAYYGSDYRRQFTPVLAQSTSPAELFAAYEPFQQHRIRLIRQHLTSRTRLLEIGCSAGMFLYHARKYAGEVAGVDFDIRSARYAAKKCRCAVMPDFSDRRRLPLRSFDLVCAFQTLEHVKDPLAFLGQMKSYLRPGGRIVIEVPNLGDVLRSTYRLPNHEQFYFHRAHLWYFTARSLGRLLRQAGFSGRISYSQDYNIANHFHWLASDAPQSGCQNGLSAPRLPYRRQVPRRVKVELDGFLMRMDEQYKQLLCRLGLASNMSYIGRLR